MTNLQLCGLYDCVVRQTATTEWRFF